MGAWLGENWFNILNGVGVVGSLLFTTVSLRSETKTRRIANLLSLTENHREIWSEFLDRPSLTRVLEASVNLQKESISLDEALFVNMVIQHLSSAYEAMRSGLSIEPEGLREDIHSFFSLPIPKAVWARIKGLQNGDFVNLVETCMESPGSDRACRSVLEEHGEEEIRLPRCANDHWSVEG